MEEDEKRDIFQTPSQFESRLSRKQEGGGMKRIAVILISIIVIGLLIFGVLKFFTGSKNSTTAANPTPTPESFPTDVPEPTETPAETPATTPGVSSTPTPTSKITPTLTPKPSGTTSVDKATGLDRAKLSIHVLNGSGTSGASKKMSDLLEGLGYNVIQIGNADSFDFAQTEIQVKPTATNASKYISLLKSDLSSSYTVGSTSKTPAEDEKADAVVIVGKQ